MARIDVTPAELLAIGSRLTALADALEHRTVGAGAAIAQLAPGLGGDVAPSALAVGEAARAAAARLVAAYRGLATVLSESAGRYVAVDGTPAGYGLPHDRGGR